MYKNKEPIILSDDKIRRTYVTLDTIHTPLVSVMMKKNNKDVQVYVEAYRIASININVLGLKHDYATEQFIYRITGVCCNVYDNTLSRDDGVAVDMERFHRAQGYCLVAYDEFISSKYQAALTKVSVERSPLTVLTYTLSSINSSSLIPAIQDKYENKLSEDEFEMLGALFDTVSDQLSEFLSSSCKFLISINDIHLGN